MNCRFPGFGVQPSFFIMIHTDEDLGRVKHEYVERREPGFIQLEEELPPHVFGLTIKLQNRETWEPGLSPSLTAEVKKLCAHISPSGTSSPTC